ncbi:MAG: branched-chain amino acid ABC transporter permease [Acidimicrobiia bacterium]
MRRRLVFPILLAAFAVAPFVGFGIPGLFSSEVSSPGTLQILAIALVYAGFAISYDVVFGYTGLLSFGHALPVALGVYGTNLIMLHAGIAYPLAVLLSLVVTVVFSTVLGAIALRTTGVAFAMVTLAFAEAFAILILSDPLRVFGGEEGLGVASDQVPDLFRGVVNTRWLYWLALTFVVFTYLLSHRVVSSRAGRVWEAIRENEARVHMVGLEPFRFKLASFVIASGLASLGGSVYLLLVRGANTSIAEATFTLALLVMVVLGGPGRLWGAALGGFVYAILSLRLSTVATSDAIDALPDWIQGPLSEPLFVLGVLFVLMMLFAPGGIASIWERVRGRATGE